jgi:glycosyltransferase involved in cell wall biosynthesis
MPMYDFSIIVPVFNRPDNLERLLNSLQNLDYPSSKYEVVIVDDGCPNPITDNFARFHSGLNFTLVRQENSGPGAARNLGARIAKGRYIVFTDDDCIADPKLLKGHADGLGGSEDIVSGGRVENGLAGNLFSEATHLLADYIYLNYNPTRINGAFFPANNLAVSRRSFLDFSGFDPLLRFGEDRDFCYRWASMGYRFANAPDAVVRHVHYLDFISFLELHFSYGRGTGQFRRRCLRKGLSRVKINPPLWYARLVFCGLKKQKSLRTLALTLLLAASQAASAAGMLYSLGTASGNKL